MQSVIPIGVAYTQLLEDVRAVIRYELKQGHLAESVHAPAEEKPLTVREAAALLDVTVQTIHEHKRRGLLKYQKLGSRTYFLRADLLAALQGHQRTAKPGKGTIKRTELKQGKNA